MGFESSYSLPRLPAQFLGFTFAVEDVISQLPSAVAAATDTPFGKVNPDNLLSLHWSWDFVKVMGK